MDVAGRLPLASELLASFDWLNAYLPSPLSPLADELAGEHHRAVRARAPRRV